MPAITNNGGPYKLKSRDPKSHRLGQNVPTLEIFSKNPHLAVNVYIIFSNYYFQS